MSGLSLLECLFGFLLLSIGWCQLLPGHSLLTAYRERLVTQELWSFLQGAREQALFTHHFIEIKRGPQGLLSIEYPSGRILDHLDTSQVIYWQGSLKTQRDFVWNPTGETIGQKGSFWINGRKQVVILVGGRMRLASEERA